MHFHSQFFYLFEGASFIWQTCANIHISYTFWLMCVLQFFMKQYSMCPLSNWSNIGNPILDVLKIDRKNLLSWYIESFDSSSIDNVKLIKLPLMHINRASSANVDKRISIIMAVNVSVVLILLNHLNSIRYWINVRVVH